MFHPLITNIGKIKDNEIDSKILELSKKYYIAARLGQGAICEQISLALEIYKEEQHRRQALAMSSTMKKQNKDLDDLINVD